MESRYKLTMCRLCLCENECFVNVFALNDCQGYVTAEVITDLLQFQVSITDVYPHVVCSACLTKLTEFRLFKENCQKSKDTYDNMFVSHDSPEEHKPEMVTIKSEEVIIDSDSYGVSENSLNETEVSCGPILLKYEVLPFSRDSHTQEKLIDSEVSGNEGIIESTAALMQDSSQVELTLLETVTHPEHRQCLEYKRSQCTSKGEIDADSCLLSISTNDKSKINSLSEDVASSSRTIERLEVQSISPGKSMYTPPFFQQDINTGKEVKMNRRMEKDIDEEGEGWKGTGTEKRAKQRREQLECFHCGIVRFSKNGLIKHMKVHGFVNYYDCAICGKVFRFHCELIRHVMTHTGSRLYKCAECSECFSESGHLLVHMRTHTDSKPYKCTKCSKSFCRNTHLKIHMSIHNGYKPYICAECSKCFSQKGNLNKHMRIHIGSKPYKCVECSKCFHRNDCLEVHMRLHTGYKPFKCVECSKCFGRNDHLQVHMRSHADYKPYKCAECSKCFRQNGNLQVHMRSHTGNKPYICAECSKSFNQICDLKRHMRIHTGSKPYKCAECSKCFTQNGSLKNHMSIHTGSKPYKCTVCSRRFTLNDGLKSHMRIHT